MPVVSRRPEMTAVSRRSEMTAVSRRSEMACCNLQRERFLSICVSRGTVDTGHEVRPTHGSEMGLHPCSMVYLDVNTALTSSTEMDTSMVTMQCEIDGVISRRSEMCILQPNIYTCGSPGRPVSNDPDHRLGLAYKGNVCHVMSKLSLSQSSFPMLKACVVLLRLWLVH